MNAPLAEGWSQGCCAEWLGELNDFQVELGVDFHFYPTYDFYDWWCFWKILCSFLPKKNNGDMIQVDESVETNN